MHTFKLCNLGAQGAVSVSEQAVSLSRSQDVAAANAHMWELLEAEAAEKERAARDDARRAKKKMKRAAAAAARATEDVEREEGGAAVPGPGFLEEAADPSLGLGQCSAAVRQDAEARERVAELGAAGRGGEANGGSQDAVQAGLRGVSGMRAAAAPGEQCNGSLRAAQQPDRAPGAVEPAVPGTLASANGAAARDPEGMQRGQAGASAAAPPARADAAATAGAGPRSAGAGSALAPAAAHAQNGAARSGACVAGDPGSGPSLAAVDAAGVAAGGCAQGAAAGAPRDAKPEAGDGGKAVPASWEHADEDADEAADPPSPAPGSPRRGPAVTGVPVGAGKARQAPAVAAGGRALAKASSGPGPAWGGAAAAASAAAAAAAAAARGARGGQPTPCLTSKPQSVNPKPQGAHAPVTPVRTPARGVGRAPVEGTTLDPWAGPAALPPRALSPRNPKPKLRPAPVQPAPPCATAPAAAGPRAQQLSASAAPSSSSGRSISPEPRAVGFQADGAANAAAQLRQAAVQDSKQVAAVGCPVPARVQGAGLQADGMQIGQPTGLGRSDGAEAEAGARSCAWSDDAVSAPGSPGADAARRAPDQALAQRAREPMPDLALGERASLELDRASSGAWGSAASVTGSRIGSGVGPGAGPGTGPDRSTPASGTTPLALSRSSQGSPPPDPWGLGLVGECLGIEALGIARPGAASGPPLVAQTWEAAAAPGDPGAGFPPGPGVGAGQLNPAAKPWRAPSEPRACAAGVGAGGTILPSPFANAAELTGGLPALGSSVGGSIWGSVGGLGLPALSGGSPFRLDGPGAAAAAAAWGSSAVNAQGPSLLLSFNRNPAGSPLGGTLVAEDERPGCVAAVVQHLLSEDGPGNRAGFEGPPGFWGNGAAAAHAPQLGFPSLGSSRSSCDGASRGAEAGFGGAARAHGGGLANAMNGTSFMHAGSLVALEGSAFYGNGAAYGQRSGAAEGKAGAWQDGLRGEAGHAAGFAAQRAADAHAAVRPQPPAWQLAAAPGGGFGSQGSGFGAGGGLGGASQYVQAPAYGSFPGAAGRDAAHAAGLPAFAGGSAGPLAQQLWPGLRQPPAALATRHSGQLSVQSALFADGASPWAAFPVRE